VESRGERQDFSILSPLAYPLSFLPSYLSIFSGLKQALKGYILLMEDSSRKIFYSNLCEK
jgi:hypothetical protein